MAVCSGCGVTVESVEYPSYVPDRYRTERWVDPGAQDEDCSGTSCDETDSGAHEVVDEPYTWDDWVIDCAERGDVPVRLPR